MRPYVGKTSNGSHPRSSWGDGGVPLQPPGRLSVDSDTLAHDRLQAYLKPLEHTFGAGAVAFVDVGGDGNVGLEDGSDNPVGHSTTLRCKSE